MTAKEKDTWCKVVNQEEALLPAAEEAEKQEERPNFNKDKQVIDMELAKADEKIPNNIDVMTNIGDGSGSGSSVDDYTNASYWINGNNVDYSQGMNGESFDILQENNMEYLTSLKDSQDDQNINVGEGAISIWDLVYD